MKRRRFIANLLGGAAIPLALPFVARGRWSNDPVYEYRPSWKPEIVLQMFLIPGH
jgi:hypothetical protein